MIGVAIVLILLAGIRNGNLSALLTGFVVSIFAFCLYFYTRGAWPGLWEVYFNYPFAANNEVPAEPAGFERIRWSLSGFVYNFAAWIALAACIVFRPRKFVQDNFALLHLVWGAVALTTMMLETRTSWPFHFLYYVVPLGVVAVYGADALASLIGRYGKPIAMICGIAALVPALVTHWIVLDQRQKAVRKENAAMMSETAFLNEAGSIAGPIYVFGSPIYHHVSQRKQALPRNGWGWEVGLKSHWDSLHSQLLSAKPAYIHVSQHYGPMISEKAPAVAQLLRRDYAPLSVQSDGQWFILQQ